MIGMKFEARLLAVLMVAVGGCNVPTAPAGSRGPGGPTGPTGPWLTCATANCMARPAPVAGDLRFAQVATGYAACGLTTAQDLYCWGSSPYGKLPTAVATPEPLRSVTSRAHICGLAESGRAYCWGGGSGYIAGAPVLHAFQTPHLVSDTLEFTSLSAGHMFTCGVLTDGGVVCWGLNTDGQTGTGASTPHPEWYIPQRVAGGRRYSAVAAGGHTPAPPSGGVRGHACALTLDGAVFCWGSNVSPEAPDRSEECAGQLCRKGPARVQTEIRFTAIAATDFETCAISESRDLYCWSDTRFVHAIPNAQGMSSLAVDWGSCGLDQDGAAFCLTGTVPAEPPGSASLSMVAEAPGLRFRQLAGAWMYSCGVTDQDIAWCWGHELFANLGR
jgi:alpha-tubulin suppressor-like RCC1 family protein